MIKMLQNLLPNCWMPETEDTRYIYIFLENRAYTIRLNGIIFHTLGGEYPTYDYVWSDEENKYITKPNIYDGIKYWATVGNLHWLTDDEYIIWIARQILKTLPKND
jgi:hypothetical protein